MFVFPTSVGIVDPYFGVDPAWFSENVAKYGFSVDACASPDNAKTPRFFGPGGEQPDGLDAPWGSERLWCAPPAEWAKLWIRKALREPGAFVAMLLEEKHREAVAAKGVTVEVGEVPMVAPRLFPDDVHPPTRWILWLKEPG